MHPSFSEGICSGGLKRSMNRLYLIWWEYNIKRWAEFLIVVMDEKSNFFRIIVQIPDQLTSLRYNPVRCTKKLIKPKVITKKSYGWVKLPWQVSWSREQNRLVKATFFKDIICINPHLDRATGRLTLLHTAGIIWEQICCNSRQGGQRVVWWYWNTIDVIDNFFPLFPTCSSIALKETRVQIRW